MEIKPFTRENLYNQFKTDLRNSEHIISETTSHKKIINSIKLDLAKYFNYYESIMFANSIKPHLFYAMCANFALINRKLYNDAVDNDQKIAKSRRGNYWVFYDEINKICLNEFYKYWTDNKVD